MEHDKKKFRKLHKQLLSEDSSEDEKNKSSKQPRSQQLVQFKLRTKVYQNQGGHFSDLLKNSQKAKLNNVTNPIYKSKEIPFNHKQD